MAFSNELNGRVHKIIARWKNTEHKKMFGGICYLLNGNMFCGIQADRLILRLGTRVAEQALQHTHVRSFNPTGKPMKGWVLVDKPAFQADQDLRTWLEQAKQFVKTLPSK